MQTKKITPNTILLTAILFFALILTAPVINKVPAHPDEHQFLLNAFSIMGGKELQNYLHIALTEYTLAGFFNLVNVFTSSGVNFPQGAPTAITYNYAHLMGAILYFITFILVAIVIQKKEKEVQLRTVIFAVLYFGSLAMFERFLRINSDSFMLFVFFNFVIISLWQHQNKASIVEMFFLNALFIFLASFTNLKSLLLMFPLFALNTVVPFIWNDKPKNPHLALSKVYRLILYLVGIIAVCLALWYLAVPQPFDVMKFWYTMKKTVIHGTQFDFDYPGQSYNSWFVYIYDLIVYQIGLNAIILTFILFAIGIYKKGKALFAEFFAELKLHTKIKTLRDGEAYKITELILFAAFIFYYLGISTKIVHWSRWGAPLGFLGLMLLAFVIERLVVVIFGSIKSKNNYLAVLLPAVVLFLWASRISLTFDLYKTGHSVREDYHQTKEDINKLAAEKNLTPQQFKEKAAWFTGYTPELKSISFEQVVEPQYQGIEYLLWPEWNSGLLLTDKAVDLSTHNQISFIANYAEDVEYRFPTSLSKYMYKARLIAWQVFGIAWIPEMDTLVEPYYVVVKIKRPLDAINLYYKVPYSEMSHYEAPYSRTFNLQNLKDSYALPPCYTYAATAYISNGKVVEAPTELAPFGKTAGMYCHSLRFRVFSKGVYTIKINGLPSDAEGQQKVYYNFGDFRWNPVEKTAVLGVVDTVITGEFGVATKEKIVPDLEFEVLYTLNQDILTEIDRVKAEAANAQAEYEASLDAAE